jgi:hypothetical protein
MNMKKLPFGTSFSSASADDKQVSAIWAMEFWLGPFAISPRSAREVSQ